LKRAAGSGDAKPESPILQNKTGRPTGRPVLFWGIRRVEWPGLREAGMRGLEAESGNQVKKNILLPKNVMGKKSTFSPTCAMMWER
jgi:hypothetical protein